MGLECEQLGHRGEGMPALLTFWAREPRYWRPLLQAWLPGVQTCGVGSVGRCRGG